jgi:ABC-type bacteriocin/lantibiotic exporter with double-glycine peptidase domain
LDTTAVYTALSLFALLADPLLSLVMALMAFAGAVGSFARIQMFLEKDGHVDSRNQMLIHPSYSLKAQQSAFVGHSDVALSESGCSETSKGSSSLLPTHTVAVHNGTFRWDVKKDADVKNVTTTIPTGSFSMLIGPSGCGKSILLKAILGEVPCCKGTIQLSTESIAYCDQSPWHMNGTVQECITGMSVFDKAWYTSVINACALAKDFEQLPRGDETVIGSKGISLSGGQSQRIVGLSHSLGFSGTNVQRGHRESYLCQERVCCP